MFTIATVRHYGSEIVQTLRGNGAIFEFRSTSPAGWGLEPTVREVSHQEARDTALVWRDLACEGELVVVDEDEMLLESYFGARHLEMLVGEAPEQCPPDEGPEVFSMENASPAAPYCPEAQADLELHNELHPDGYGVETYRELERQRFAIEMGED